MADIQDDYVSYGLEDVDAAEASIKAECPSAITNRFDYDFGLSVADARRTAAFIVFRPERKDICQAGLKGNVEEVISALKSLG